MEIIFFTEPASFVLLKCFVTEDQSDYLIKTQPLFYITFNKNHLLDFDMQCK